MIDRFMSNQRDARVTATLSICPYAPIPTVVLKIKSPDREMSIHLDFQKLRTESAKHVRCFQLESISQQSHYLQAYAETDQLGEQPEFLLDLKLYHGTYMISALVSKVHWKSLIDEIDEIFRNPWPEAEQLAVA